MAYYAPSSLHFLKDSRRTDSEVLRSELRKLEEETALLQTEITAGINGWADIVYIGYPYEKDGWKIEAVSHDTTDKELRFFRKSADGELVENWEQFFSLPQEYAEAYRYNNSTPRVLTVQNTWYPSIGLTKGNFHILEFVEPGDGNNYMLVPDGHDGLYKTNWVTSLSGPTGKTIEMGYEINGVVQTNSISRIKLGSQDTVNFSGTNMAYLYAGDQCKLVTRCIDSSSVSIVYVHSNINTTRVG